MCIGSLYINMNPDSGDGQDQGEDDDGRHYHDQLPAARRVPQLLPQHHLQPGGPGNRHMSVT